MRGALIDIAMLLAVTFPAWGVALLPLFQSLVK